MRLSNLDSGQRGGAKLMLGLMQRMMGGSPPDVVKTHLYRPSFYGRAALEIVQAALRGPSDWTIGERELFAAYTSKLNQCPF